MSESAIEHAVSPAGMNAVDYVRCRAVPSPPLVGPPVSSGKRIACAAGARRRARLRRSMRGAAAVPMAWNLHAIKRHEKM
ncbi:hypothetical protein DIE07_12935 [Burkholderia sp. Bp9002]|nr:hypothetical protein DIE07_12935 [Burkholderia sp. Bp9002]